MRPPESRLFQQAPRSRPCERPRWLTASSLLGEFVKDGFVSGALPLAQLADPEQLASHLRAEMLYNFDPLGFVSITNRTTPPPDGQRPDDTKLWQQAGPDWSALALMLGPAHSPAGANVTAALDPAFRQLDNWRSRLRNLWNLAGSKCRGPNTPPRCPPATR